MVESPDFLDPRYGIPVFSLYGEVRRPTAAMMDTFDVLLVDLQDLGCRIYTFITTLRYVLEAAAEHGKSGLGARPPQSGRPPGRRPDAARRLGKLRRRRPDADAPRPDAWANWPLVHRHAQARRRLPRHRDAGLAARGRARLRLAAGRADLDQPQPECPQPVDGPLLRRHRDARRHDALRRARHDAAARTVRRARPRRPRRARRNARPRAALAGRLPAARMLVRTDLPQARRQAVQRRADPRRGRQLRPRRLPPLAPAGAGLQGASADSSRITRCGAISPTNTNTTAWPST